MALNQNNQSINRTKNSFADLTTFYHNTITEEPPKDSNYLVKEIYEVSKLTILSNESVRVEWKSYDEPTIEKIYNVKNCGDFFHQAIDEYNKINTKKQYNGPVPKKKHNKKLMRKQNTEIIHVFLIIAEKR